MTMDADTRAEVAKALRAAARSLSADGSAVVSSVMKTGALPQKVKQAIEKLEEATGTEVGYEVSDRSFRFEPHRGGESVGYFRITLLDEYDMEKAREDCVTSAEGRPLWVVKGAEWHDKGMRSKGFGKLAYEALLSFVDDRKGVVGPHDCEFGGSVSNDAKNMWKSLARRHKMDGPLIVFGSAVSASSLRIEEYKSPLDYNRSGNVMRLALVDARAGEPDPHDSYFAEITRTRNRAKNGKPLKKPKTELVSPGAAPGVVAFLDWHQWGPKAVYIDYMKSRRDMRGKKHIQRLLDHLYKEHKNDEIIHWGKVMNEAAWSLFERYQGLEEHGYPHTIGSRDF